MSAVPHDGDTVAIDVPADVAAAIKARVESGEYASQGEVVRNGLRLLTEEANTLRDPELEDWLRTDVVPIAQATLADPCRSIPAEQVRNHFATKRARRA